MGYNLNIYKKTYTNFKTAKIINNTGITIPPNVLSLLKRGSEFATGGSTRNNSSDIYLELNELFKTFRAQARKSGVSEINIEHIRSYTSLCGKDVSTCYTKDDKITDFFNFQNANPNILLLGVDKTNDLIFLEKSEYHKKLTNLFENSKFKKLENFDLQDELISYRSMLTNSIENCLGQSNKYLVQPMNSSSSLYGKVKCHKENWPLRPISTGYSHIAHGAETYIKTIIEPLNKKCSYAVNSQKSFKTRFLVEKQKFDSNLHEVVCFDIKSMYPSINITRTVSYILIEIFRNPKLYFTPEKDSKGYTLPIPTRAEFKLFLLSVLKDFNLFECQIGIFKQLK